jgi:hypothetical protein
MSDLQLNFLFNFGGQPAKLRETKAIQQFRFPPSVENKAGIVEQFAQRPWIFPPIPLTTR